MMDLLGGSPPPCLPPPLGQPLIRAPREQFPVCPGVDPFEVPSQEDEDDPFGFGLQPVAETEEETQEILDALRILVDEYERAICRLVSEREIGNTRLKQMFKTLDGKLKDQQRTGNKIREKIERLERKKLEFDGTIAELNDVQLQVETQFLTLEEKLKDAKKGYDELKKTAEKKLEEHIKKADKLEKDNKIALIKLRADMRFVKETLIPRLTEETEVKLDEERRLMRLCDNLVTVRNIAPP